MKLFCQHEAEYIYEKSASRSYSKLDRKANVHGERHLVTFENNREVSRRRAADEEIYVTEAKLLHIDVKMDSMRHEVLTSENMEFVVEENQHIQVSNPVV